MEQIILTILKLQFFVDFNFQLLRHSHGSEMESHIDLIMNYEQVKMKTYILSLQPATKVRFLHILKKFFQSIPNFIRRNIAQIQK